MFLQSDLDKMEEMRGAKGKETLDRWLEIEECLDSIVLDVQNRCYPEQSDTGVRGLMLLVRRHLWKVEQLLLEDHA